MQPSTKWQAAADEAARKAKPAIDRATEFAHQAVDRAQSAAAPAAAWLGDQTENLKATQQKLVDDTCEYVSANPLKSVAIALVAGHSDQPHRSLSNHARTLSKAH
jgi:ElaB/YqjD/DUF883 family membrane-anchored ribosome-binding protein